MSNTRQHATAFTLIELLIALAIIGIVVAMVAGTIAERERPSFELKTADWECSRSDRVTHLQPMLIGKLTILQPISRTVCIEYRRVEKP